MTEEQLKKGVHEKERIDYFSGRVNWILGLDEEVEGLKALNLFFERSEYPKDPKGFNNALAYECLMFIKTRMQEGLEASTLTFKEL